jgi:predicted HTH transcriptional regulator
VPDASWEDLDPLEFVRLRRMVHEFHGDASLLELDDDQVARALGLVQSEQGQLRPTLAGLLLVGQESALREHVPAHEVAFQVLRGTDVAMNEFRRWPLLRTLEWILEAFQVRARGFEPEQMEQMVLQYVRAHGRITRHEVMELCRVSDRQATYLLRKLVERGLLAKKGRGRGTLYV